MIVYGSFALSTYNKLARVAKDIDVIVKNDEFETIPSHFEGVKLDCTIAKEGTTDHYLVNKYSGILPLDVLFWIKMSHRFKDSVHFLKTRDDIFWFRRNYPDITNSINPWWYGKRVTESTTHHPDLTKSKKGFFDETTNGIKQYIEHDTLHEIVATYINNGIKTEPMYKSYAADGHEVLSSKSKFHRLPFQDKCLGVIEEATVLALERSIIPFFLVRDKDVTHGDVKRAYTTALQKVCTRITSGWFRDFAWEFYHCVTDVKEIYGIQNVVKMELNK